jgi:membrane-bound serine protease (ClpP class)
MLRSFALLTLAVGWTMAGTAAAQEAERGLRDGRLIRVPAPISRSVHEGVLGQAKSFIDDAKQNGKWPVIVLEIEPGDCSFGAAYDLAQEVLKLEGATTVAYVPPDADGQPQALKGHAVLLALACEQIALHPDGTLGAGGPEERPTATQLAGYAEIAKARRTVPEDLAVALVDSTVELWEVERPSGLDFVRAERLPEIRKSKDVIVRKKWFEAGKPRFLKGRDAAAMGVVHRDRLVTGHKELAQALDLPPEAVEYDPLWGAARRGAIVTIRGKLKPGDLTGANKIQHKIQEAIAKHDANLLILEISSVGGTPEESLTFASFLLGTVRPGGRQTVAYITHQAAGDAAVIALACDRVVMQQGATLGGSGAIVTDRGALNLAAYSQSVAKLAQDRGRSPSLAKALIDPSVSVSRYQRDDGLQGYFTEADLQRQADPRRWQPQEEIKKPGSELALDAQQAVTFRMASDVVRDFGELKDLLGLKYDPPRMDSTWLDVLLGALQHPAVMVALLMIGLTAFYAEMNSPGHGVGGFIAALCFLLYFWANFLGGSADWLEVLMFVLGLLLLLIELFVLPGFGIVGIGGGLLMVLSVIMAMQTFHGLPASVEDMLELRSSLTVVTLAAIGSLALAAVLRRYLPATPVLSDLILPPPDAGDAQRQELHAGAARYDHLVGELGVAVTQLTPSGKARIGDELLDVISEGEFIERGQAVMVVETVGSRIVVRAAS